MSMKCFKLLLIVVLTVGWFTVGFSQSTPTAGPVYDPKTMLPTSPEAAILGRFGDIPIGYYTGTADVSIPLYTIKETGIDIPIVLRYHGSGIKVWDQAANVGLGWSLEPAGSIIQVVNGVEDGMDHIVSADPAGYNFLITRRLLGEYGATNDVGTNDWPCAPGDTLPEDSEATLNNLIAGGGQPDIYIYNFGGHSGKFYINFETGQPVLMDKHDSLNIVRNSGGWPWTITTMEGDVYHFSTQESSSTYLVENHTGYTYKLDQIVLHTGKMIGFQYAQGFYSWFTYTERYHQPYPDQLNPLAESGVQALLDYPQFNTQNLTKIISSEVQVNFNMEDRTDLMSEADIDTIPNNGVLSTKRIKSLDILSTVTGQKIKTFRFFYSYFPYSTVGGSFVGPTDTSSVLGSRLRLDSLRETGYLANGDSLNMPCYKFAYNTTNLLPLKTSFAQDFWGYYNGQNNSSLIPDLSFFYYNQDPTMAAVPSYLMDSTFTSERAPDSAVMTAGMLEQITYPTGGYTQFDYTPNSFSNYYYPDQGKINATLKDTTVKDINVTPYPSAGFTLQRNTIISFNAQIMAGNPNQGLTFSLLQPSFVRLEKVNSSGTTILQNWQMTDADSTTFNANGETYQWVQNLTVQYDPTPGTYYVVVTSLPDNIGPQTTGTNTAFVSCSFRYYDTTGSPVQRSLGGGVRVSGIRNYTDSGTLASHKVIQYVNTDGTSSGLLMSPLAYFYTQYMVFFNLIGSSGDATVDPEESADSIWFISAENSIPFSIGAGGNPVGYSRVEEQDIAPDGTTNGVHIYEYNNIIDDVATNCPDNPHLINGLISRETLLNSNADTVQQMIYNYLVQGAASFNGIKIFSLYDGITQCQANDDDVSIGNGVDPFYFPLNDKYLIMFYPVNSIWYEQQQKITKYYTSNDILADTVTSGYNSMGQLAKTTSYNSKHQLSVTQSSYPIDSASSTNVMIQYMLSNNMYDYPLQRISLINDSEINRMNIAYTNVLNLLPTIARDSVQLSYNGGQLFTDVNIDGYGPTTNVTHFIQRGSEMGLLWNLNNNQVIAQVKNADYGSFAYTSFEPDESSSWTLSDTTRNRSNSLTGGQCYTFSSSSQITTSVPFRQYVISYWSMNGPITVSPSGTPGTSITGPTRNGWTYYEYDMTAPCTNFTLSGPGITIDELRLYEVNSQMTTYTYSPLVGVTSQCDVGNHVTYYEYDALGRLSDIKDQDGNILKTYKYHYYSQAN
jgi:YD repeat-containing protein